jgi:hypothetical protein
MYFITMLIIWYFISLLLTQCFIAGMLMWYLFSYCWFVSRELAGLLLSHVCSASCGEETATISKMAPTKESGPHMVVPNRMGLVYSRGKMIS